MYNLITGCILLSLLHAAIPNHWAPVLAIAKAERWTVKRAISVTILAGLAHVISTILLGLFLGLVGWRLSKHFEQFTSIIAPALLILIGLFYAFAGRGHQHLKSVKIRERSRLIFGLAATMFLAPCLEIQSFFLAAGAQGTFTLAIIMLTYLVVSVSAMSILVALVYSGLKQLHLTGFAQYERKITGAILIAIGIAGFFTDW